jgi:hypothetical protein
LGVIWSGKVPLVRNFVEIEKNLVDSRKMIG